MRAPTSQATGERPWWSKPREEMVAEAEARSKDMSSSREGRRHKPAVIE
jgi:hypothetical protein